MLNKEILLKARNYLLELYKKVQELEIIRNMKVNIAFNNNDGNEKKLKKKEKKIKIVVMKKVMTIKAKIIWMLKMKVNPKKIKIK